MLYMDINKQFATLQEQVNSKINNYERINTLLRKENEHLKSEHYKDDEIQKLKQENEELRESINRGFPISESEWEAIKNWQDAHILARHGGNYYSGVSGSRFSYEFVPTSIGTFGTCKCCCGAEFTFQED